MRSWQYGLFSVRSIGIFTVFCSLSSCICEYDCKLCDCMQWAEQSQRCNPEWKYPIMYVFGCYEKEKAYSASCLLTPTHHAWNRGENTFLRPWHYGFILHTHSAQRSIIFGKTLYLIHTCMLHGHSWHDFLSIVMHHEFDKI